jgi:hypothetical protein
MDLTLSNREYMLSHRFFSPLDRIVEQSLSQPKFALSRIHETRFFFQHGSLLLVNLNSSLQLIRISYNTNCKYIFYFYFFESTAPYIPLPKLSNSPIFRQSMKPFYC